MCERAILNGTTRAALAIARHLKKLPSSVFHLAVYRGNAEFVEAALVQGFETRRTVLNDALWQASTHGNRPAVVRSILAHAADRVRIHHSSKCCVRSARGPATVGILVRHQTCDCVPRYVSQCTAST